ncbi:MAG: BMC domain-containing protein [Halanaerobium sp.]
MSRTAIGMVETVGLLAAYEAADVAVKSANVKLIGYEISRGGMVVIKFSGDVGAVKSAVDAAAAAASRLGEVFSSHVIPRPHQDIDKKMILTDDTVGYKKDKTPEESAEISSKEAQEIAAVEEKEEVEEKEGTEIVEDEEQLEEEVELEEQEEAETEDEESDESKKESEEELDSAESEEERESDKDDEDICNLCGDPACPRRKGELRTDCIHYDEIMGDDE